VLPLRLFAHGGSAYAVCSFPGGSAVMVLNLQRLLGLKVLARTAKPPTGLDLDKWEQSAFGIVAGGTPARFLLRFDRATAPYIRERIWHPTQTLRELRGGRVELSFVCGDTFEVSSWVASWRDHVEVIEPASLRKELAALGGWLQGTYRAVPAVPTTRRRIKRTA